MLSVGLQGCILPVSLNNALQSLQVTHKPDGELIGSGMVHTAEGFRPISAEGNKTIEKGLEVLELDIRVMEADEALRAEV
jgi:hypothetical protein